MQRFRLEAATAGLDWRNSGQFRRNFVWLVGGHLIFSQGDQWHPDIRLAGRAVNQARGGQNFGTEAFERHPLFHELKGRS